jgi:phosphatidate cytidylyltransferase
MWARRTDSDGMISRYVLGVLLFAMALVVIAVRGPLLVVTFYAFLITAQLEMYLALRRASLHPCMWACMLFAALIYPFYLWKGLPGVVTLFVVLSTVNLVWAIFLPQRKYLDIMASMLLMIYPVWPMFLLILISQMGSGKLSTIALGIAVFSPVVTDIFAYFVGRYFGRRKLSPLISPKKTLEGALGGLVLSSLIISIAGWFVFRYYSQELDYYHYVVLGFLCSIFAQAGDLTASAIKRFSGIKDFGNVLLGHGGVLDRIDGILLGAVAVYGYFSLFII